MVEDILNDKLPGHGIKAKPHIEFRIKTLKRNHNVVYDMLNGVGCSGFGWNPNINMVVIWDGYVKSHKDAGQWRNRSFPHYDMLCTVFGKDRAIGKDVIAEDVLEELNRNKENVDTQNLGLGVEEAEHSISNASTNDEGNSHSGKKRKSSNDSLDACREVEMVIGSKIEEATNKFSRVLGVDSDIAVKRDKINEELEKLSNLSRIERHGALLAIACDHEITACFFTLKDEEKEDFLKTLLRGDL